MGQDQAAEAKETAESYRGRLDELRDELRQEELKSQKKDDMARAPQAPKKAK
jgi:hypothetical protein